jgi:prepilin-type processing-associated H-X9-DG protein
MTMVDMLVVIAIIAAIVIFAVMSNRGTNPDKARVLHINCVNNLKQIGLSYRVWEEDNSDKFPMAVPQIGGGSMEFITGPYAFRHYQVMSNELSTPKVLLCPEETDQGRLLATNFVNMNNSNISFFVGVDANETAPAMILSGDHNITNGLPIKNGLLELTTNQPSGWTTEMHNKVGNIALADGSVEQVTIATLRAAVANTGAPTNRLQMPVLTP